MVSRNQCECTGRVPDLDEHRLRSSVLKYLKGDLGLILNITFLAEVYRFIQFDPNHTEIKKSFYFITVRFFQV